MANTDCDAADSIVGAQLIEALAGAGVRVRIVAADGAYDTKDFYGTCVETGATQILVPPRKGASVWDVDLPGARIRNKHWSDIAVRKGSMSEDERRKEWKVKMGYHVRSLVETAMYRIAVATGSKCRLRSADGRMAEIYTMVTLLNRNAKAGQPIRVKRSWSGTWCAQAPTAA